MFEQVVFIIKMTLFLWWIHFIPPVLAVIMEDRWALPLDFNRRFLDGKPILGKHKTIRGIVGSTVAATVTASAFGLTHSEGFLLALLGMLGDSITSFIKRRLDKPSGTIMPVIDQLLEGLLPLIAIKELHQIGMISFILILFIFSLGAYAGSIFYKNILLVKPIPEYPRNLTPRTRLREWRACQIRNQILRVFFNFEDAIYYHLLLKAMLKMCGYYDRGVKNALDIQIRIVKIPFPDLPSAFNGYSILFLSDLHLNCHEKLLESLLRVLDQIPECDICILGGDYRMEEVGSYHSPFPQLSRIIPALYQKSRNGIFAVLGNHDCIEMVSWLEERGVRVLINENSRIFRNGDSIYLVGVDDPHYFRCDDVENAFKGVPADGFSIFVAHSPEVYRKAHAFKARLYLCGHTHAGQIQLPRIGPVFTHSRTGWRFVYGLWKYGSMWGYTSSGVGASGIFARFNTRGEVVRIILLKEGEGDYES
ncbi:MAG: CDP-archaeol synthase [Thermodesulforhabdaceae bacterium]